MALIIRTFNPTDEAAQQSIEFCGAVESARLADLREQPEATLPVRGSAVTVAAGPKQIATVRVRLRGPARPAARRG